MHYGYGDVRNLIFKPLIVIFVTKGSINEKFDFYVGSLEGLFQSSFVGHSWIVRLYHQDG
jgi:hypothetical protein